jgi:hypothetical protein
MDWMTEVQSLAEAGDFSSNICIQTDSGTHPASCTMGIRCPFTWGEVWLRHVADNSPPTSDEVKKEQELYLLFPQAPPWQDRFVFVVANMAAPGIVR